MAKRPGFICKGLTWKDAVWVGCEAEVVRWDGANFTPFLPRPKKGSAEYYQPMVGPEGQLWVRLGKKTWDFDEAGQRFVPVTPPWTIDPYDARFFEGQPYWIDFLHALHVGPAHPPAAAPSCTPAAIRAPSASTRAGALWVEDFESGLFRLENGRFVKQPGLDAKGCGRGVRRGAQAAVAAPLHPGAGAGSRRHANPSASTWPSWRTCATSCSIPSTGDVLGGRAGRSWCALRADGPTWVKQRFRVK